MSCLEKSFRFDKRLIWIDLISMFSTQIGRKKKYVGISALGAFLLSRFYAPSIAPPDRVLL